MSKLSWSMADKATMIKNIAKAEREVLNAKGANKKKLSRYINYMKQGLKKKGFKGKLNTLQPKLKGFEKAFETINIDDLITKKMIDQVVQEEIDLLRKQIRESIATYSKASGDK